MPLPRLAGLGLRTPHLKQILSEKPAVAWWEVHSENYFGGGAPVAALERIRADYPVSLHGVGMGLGSPGALDEQHLQQLKALVDRIAPQAISEHLAWNRLNGQAYTDLLPVPRVEGVVDLISEHIDIVQDQLQRQILIENVSSYVQFSGETYSESEILAELVARTGCGLLLDVNNLYVSQFNLGIDAYQELNHLPWSAIGEIHIAGFEVFNGVAIDTHGAEPVDEVWELLNFVIRKTGPIAVLLERDNNIPPLDELLTSYQTLSNRCNSLWIDA